MHRVPNMDDIEVDKIVNSPEIFTPDTRMILGESSEIDNYFVAGGMNANTVSLAGGAGRYVAELIAFGETGRNLFYFFISISNQSINQLRCSTVAM